MISRYFYQSGDVAYGPVSHEELVSLVRRGVIQPEVLLRREEDKNWQPAGEVAGLFHMAGRADEVSRWRAERRREFGDRIQGVSEEANTLREAQAEEIIETDSSELSREIKAATYAAARQLRDRYGRPIVPMASRQESHVVQRVRELWTNSVRILKFLLSIPFVIVIALGSRLFGGATLPRWVEESLDRLFSRKTLITAFRWGMTLAVPNLVAWGIFSWSNMEAQRYPSRNPSQVSPKMFPGWGACSSEGEYLFLLIDMMLIAAVATYIGIRWLEAKADD